MSVSSFIFKKNMSLKNSNKCIVRSSDCETFLILVKIMKRFSMLTRISIALSFIIANKYVLLIY